MPVLAPAKELALDMGSGLRAGQALHLTVYCRESCGGILLKLPPRDEYCLPISRESGQSHFIVPPCPTGRVRLYNPTPQPVVVASYRFSNYLAKNSGFPRLLLLLPGAPGPELGWGRRLAWLLLALALQMGGLGAAAAMGRRWRAWLCCLVPAPPWLALGAGLWLGREGCRLVISGETLAILAGAVGGAAAALRWGPRAWRGLAAWARGPLAARLAQPTDPAGRCFLEHWAAPTLYGIMGIYLAYVAIFSLVPGWRAQEWTVEPYTWLVMAGLVAGLLAAWRLGRLAWLGRLDFLPGWSILLIAVLPRVTWALLSGVKQGSDCGHFANMAMKVYKGMYFLLPYKDVGQDAVQKSIYWLVGTGPSIVAAGTYWLVGPCQEAALTVAALVSAAEVYLVYRIALSLWDRRVAALAGLLLALCPHSPAFCQPDRQRCLLFLFHHPDLFFAHPLPRPVGRFGLGFSERPLPGGGPMDAPHHAPVSGFVPDPPGDMLLAAVVQAGLAGRRPFAGSGFDAGAHCGS